MACRSAPSIDDGRADAGRKGMPYDGLWVLPRSPLAVLLEADRKLIAERRAAKPRARPVPSAGKLFRRKMLARKSLVVLQLLEDLLGDDGQYWMRNAYADGGSYCLVGGLRRIRAIRGFGDHAGIYLRRSVSKISRNENSIIRFNDSRSGYAEIRAAILLARKLAREVADG
jgi:hypothetical protein